MQENTNPASTPGTEPPAKNRASNVLFVAILAAWLLFLLFFGGKKGPG